MGVIVFCIDCWRGCVIISLCVDLLAERHCGRNTESVAFSNFDKGAGGTGGSVLPVLYLFILLHLVLW